MNYPLISVITVSYNAVLTIEQTILSVINQTYLNIEYIIIDGGSTDGTVNVIKKYADKIAYWVSESDKGIYDAMNKGIAYSHGEYCNFINAGDKFCSSSILKQVMDFNHVADIIVGQDLHVNEHNKIVSRSVLPRRYNLLHFYITTIPHQSCFIRASLLKKYYYDTSLKIVSDWKFYLQSIVLGGHSVAAYNNVIVICNPRGASSDNNRIKEEREKVLKDLLPAYIVNDYQCLSCLGEEFIENALFLFNNHWIVSAQIRALKCYLYLCWQFNPTIMYSSEDLERFYFQYQTEAVPHGVSLQSFCSTHNVPYNLFHKWYKDTRRKIVEVQVDGVPPVPPSDSVPSSPSVENPVKKDIPSPHAGNNHRNPCQGARVLPVRISVELTLSNGLHILQKDLDYPGLYRLIQKLEVLC